MSKYVIAVGSPFNGGETNGMILVGPFENFGRAEQYLEQQKYETYQVIELEAPLWGNDEEEPE